MKQIFIFHTFLSKKRNKQKAIITIATTTKNKQTNNNNNGKSFLLPFSIPLKRGLNLPQERLKIYASNVGVQLFFVSFFLQRYRSTTLGEYSKAITTAIQPTGKKKHVSCFSFFGGKDAKNKNKNKNNK